MGVNSAARKNHLARKVLQSGPVEADVRNRICKLLDAIGFDEHYLERRAGSGPSDIQLPRQRTIVETKAAGGADSPGTTTGSGESPFGQLDRYLQAEIARSRRISDGGNQRRWTGMLTDGRIWHSWSYEHRDSPAAQPETRSFLPANGSELVQWLTQALGGDPVGKPWIPQNPVEVFHGQEYALRDIHDSLSGKVRRETDTKISLWRDMLRSSGMEPESAAARFRLFSTHCFLIALARGVVWTMAHPREAPVPEELLGGGIVSWIVQTTAGWQWAEALFERIGSYEWRLRRGDVLKPLYEAFVDKDDRRDFGEVYTPDWLAELVVDEILDEEWRTRAINAALGEIHNQMALRGIGMLDPCCGSGTFLYHAARLLLESSQVGSLPDGLQADVVSRLVCGMDIHPVACEFARATLLRALPCEPPFGPSALRVWNGDSLLLHGTEEGSFFSPQNGEVVFHSPGGGLIRLPEEFIANPGFPGLIEDLTDTAAQGRPLSPHVEHSVADGFDRTQLFESHAVLRKIIEREGNSVWTWFMRQTVGPYLVSRHKVDRIVSNPPWVKMATIQHLPRKRRLEAFAGDLGLWQGGNQAPHADIAQLFIKHCRERYLHDRKKNPAAWVVKHSAIRSGNWENFRVWRAENGLEGQILDLAAAKVFGGGDARKCCVLFDARCTSFATDNHLVEVRVAGTPPPAEAALPEAMEALEFVPAPAPLLEGPSEYMDEFYQGASIVPHVLTLADRIAGGGETRTVTTRRSNQPPWKDVDPQTANLPAAWLVPLLRSDHLLPFATAPEAPDQAILPLDDHGRLIEFDVAREFLGWRRLDAIYRELRGGGTNTPQTLLARLDYHRNSSRQLPLAPAVPDAPRMRLIYPKSGDIMRSCRVPIGTVLINDQIYGSAFDDADEAAYLAALLNAPALNPSFVQSRRSGRDFHLHPWRRVPIPRYDLKNELHRELAALCCEAEVATAAWLGRERENLPRSQIGRSKRIREMLSERGLFGRLNAAAARLLPDQCAYRRQA